MFWSTQTKLKGLTPAIGASPNFVLPQKVLSDSNNIEKDHDIDWLVYLLPHRPYMGFAKLPPFVIIKV